MKNVWICLFVAVTVICAVSSRNIDHPHHFIGRPNHARHHDFHSGRASLHHGFHNNRHNLGNPCPQMCPLIYQPVCGTNGKTYDNECLLNAEACVIRMILRVEKQGRC